MNGICNFSLEELKAWLGEEPSFRARQIFEWLYQKGALSFDAMANLPRSLRTRCQQELAYFQLEEQKVLHSKDGETVKFLFSLEDGKKVESVLIFSGKRRTVCVSSQVGCPARCSFCASGKEGLLRNLSTGEIVEQALHIDRFLKKKGEKITHVVFMGMGEPLANYDAVIKAIRILVAKETFHLSQRRITLSTVGMIEGIERLAREKDVHIHLVLSLHAPNQNMRKKLIPFARRYPLEELLLAADRYAQTTKRDITYEYTLLAGINDSLSLADELITLLKGKQCTVNLIPYNPIEGLYFHRPRGAAVEAFRDHLKQGGLNVTWRYTKGKDIQAACGQLALISASQA